MIIQKQPKTVDIIKLKYTFGTEPSLHTMDIKGVITGDIVNSTAIEPQNKQKLIESIQTLATELQAISQLKLEIFRGDSFQLLVDEPSESLRIAILLRAGLQMNTPTPSGTKWDARVALGIGTISYEAENVVTSDGEAFHNSGWQFDDLGKSRLGIRTPWLEVNNELDVSTPFADEIITSWSTSQAQTIYHAIASNKTQKEIAAQLATSPQNVSKLLNAAKEQLLRRYIDRFKQLIINHR